VDKAIDAFRTGASNGHVASMSSLGAEYCNQGDHKLAFRWMEMAGKRGDKYAQSVMAQFYRHGVGCEKSEREAVKWDRMQ
jgi:TPR repeat protein